MSMKNSIIDKYKYLQSNNNFELAKSIDFHLYNFLTYMEPSNYKKVTKPTTQPVKKINSSKNGAKIIEKE